VGRTEFSEFLLVESIIQHVNDLISSLRKLQVLSSPKYRMRWV
jgi:hypothetical protein